MIKRLYVAILTIILGSIGSLLAIYIERNYIKAIGYLLIVLSAIVLIFELYRNYPLIFGIKWRYACTVIVLDVDKVLLIWHPQYNIWLPPGKRIPFQRFPHQAAIEAVLKETGYNVEFDEDFHLPEKSIDRDTFQIPQPYFVMREDQGHRGGIKSHYDFYYVCKAEGNSNRIHGVLKHKWFRTSELGDLVDKGELYADILNIIEKVCSDKKVKRKT